MISSILLGVLFLILLLIGLFFGLLFLTIVGSFIGVKLESLSIVAVVIATLIVGMFFT